MTLDLMKERGTPLDEQAFDWGDLVRAPISKLNDRGIATTQAPSSPGGSREPRCLSAALAQSA